jgi:hypothetical protein
VPRAPAVGAPTAGAERGRTPGGVRRAAVLCTVPGLPQTERHGPAGQPRRPAIHNRLRSRYLRGWAATRVRPTAEKGRLFGDFSLHADAPKSPQAIPWTRQNLHGSHPLPCNNFLRQDRRRRTSCGSSGLIRPIPHLVRTLLLATAFPKASIDRQNRQLARLRVGPCAVMPRAITPLGREPVEDSRWHWRCAAVFRPGVFFS